MMWTMMLHPPLDQCQRKTDTDRKAQRHVKGKLFHGSSSGTSTTSPNLDITKQRIAAISGVGPK